MRSCVDPVFITVSDEESGTQPSVDNETENWPVPFKFAEKLHAIKYEYVAQPLPVYVDNDKFVEVQDVVKVLSGALVKIQFEFQHYHISKKNQDSFNATMVQIIVLQHGAPPPTSALKRKNIREGPVRQNPILLERCGRDDVGKPVAGPSRTKYCKEQLAGAATVPADPIEDSMDDAHVKATAVEGDDGV